MSEEKKFVEGLFTSRRDNAPEFIIANLSFKTERFIEWLKQNTNSRGYCNIDIKRGREGNIYSELNEWKPNDKFVKTDNGISTEEVDEEEIRVENIPF